MISGIVVLEDTILKFEIGGDCNSCKLTISDSPTGESKEVIVNNEQLGAIVGTAICGTNDAVMNAARPLVRQVIDEAWPSHLQPCPL